MLKDNNWEERTSQCLQVSHLLSALGDPWWLVGNPDGIPCAGACLLGKSKDSRRSFKPFDRGPFVQNGSRGMEIVPAKWITRPVPPVHSRWSKPYAALCFPFFVWTRVAPFAKAAMLEAGVRDISLTVIYFWKPAKCQVFPGLLACLFVWFLV